MDFGYACFAFMKGNCRYLFKILFLILFINSETGYGQWISNNELLRAGAHYYPDRFPKNQWSKDFEKIASTGFSFVHFGPFLWSSIEPEEGRYNLEWLEEAIGMASKNGLKVVLATPSALAPLWIHEKYPETTSKSIEGYPKSPFEIHSCSWSSSKFKELVFKINQVLLKKFGNDSRILGWQIDHDPNQYISDPDYGQIAKDQYIEWLKEKYKNIENLNSGWKMEKTGQAFSSFSQVRFPTIRDQGGNQNRLMIQDFRIYISEIGSGFIRTQAEEIRRQSNKGHWVTSDIQPWLLFGDHFFNTDLDFISLNYSAVSGFTSGFGQEGFRINDGFSLSLPLDFYKSSNSSVSMTNFSPGQVQTGRTNPLPFPGSNRLRMFQSVASSGKLICINPFRQDSDGSTSFVEGVVGPDGVSMSQGGKEIAEALKEIRELQKFFRPEMNANDRLNGLKTAVLVKRENFWDLSQNKLSSQWNSTLHLAKYYEAIRSLQVPLEFISEESDFSGFKFIVVPGYSIVSTKLADKLSRFAEKGGNLILSCRFAQKDGEGRTWKNAPNNPLKTVAGISNRFQDMLPEGRNAKVSFNSKNYDWNNWAEVLQLEPGTESIVQFVDQFYKNSTGVSRKMVGKGSVTYIGVETDAFKLEREILKTVFQKGSGKSMQELPEGVEVQFSGGLWFGFNFHSTDSKIIPIPTGAKILLGSAEIKPAGVVVWTEK